MPRITAPEALPRPAEVDPLLAEAQLIARAQRSLEHAPADALALLDAHRRQFPNGHLAEEREVHAIDALSRLDRPDEATRRARAFQLRYPASAHAARVDEILRRRVRRDVDDEDALGDAARRQ